MNYRNLGKTGWQVSDISLGTWQVGGKWGQPFDMQNAERVINTAIDQGINFIDTADVYSDGLSETAVANVAKQRGETVYIATKCGRNIKPHVNAGYIPDVLRRYIEDSLKRMKMETLDLVQLHCPPVEVYYRPEIFELFDRLKDEGKVKAMGVSVEKIEEAIKAIEFPNVATVQIIFNMFRHRPADLFFKLAKERDVGIIVRVPLASGLLSGKYSRETTFGENDHRTYNREGASFDKGETFSGVDYDLGLEAVEKLKALFDDDAPLAAWAIRWVLMFPEVSTVIPGASREGQVQENIKASGLPALNEGQMQGVREIYEEMIKPKVHHLW
jgi:aryl-alcohol dehydrogenase-like predicted oxidoreductase